MRSPLLQTSACCLVGAALVFRAWLAAAAAEVPSSSEMLVPVDGPRFAASVVAIDSDWKLRLSTADGRREIPAGEIVRWGAYVDKADAAQIVMADGGILSADVIDVRSETLTVFNEFFGEVDLPLASVRGIAFQPSLDPAVRDQRYLNMMAATGVADVAIFDNGDSLAGSLVGFKSAAAENDVDAILFSVQQREIRLPLDKLSAMIGNPALIEFSQPRGLRVWLGFSDGSLISVHRIEQQGRLVRLHATGDVVLEADGQSIWRDLVFLSPRGNRVTYASDVSAVGYKHIPFLDVKAPLGVDRNVLGSRLRSGGKLFLKGMGMRSTARVAFDLNQRYSRFEADLALDDQAGRSGSVRFRVFLAEPNGSWQSVFESPIVRGGDRPLPVAVDTSEAVRIALIVDFADRGDVCDYANWLDARFIVK